MNLFRFVGDMLHLSSILLLLLKIYASHGCRGISLKTQEMFLIVFLTRYLDLFWSFVSMYNSVMKMVYITATAATVYLIRFKYRHTYDRRNDSFPHVFLIVPCALLALVVNDGFNFSEVLWTFSIYLEAVAILPQISLLSSTGQVEHLTIKYIVCLGSYRALYIMNWIYRFATEGNTHWIEWVSGVVQTALYADFFYYFILSRWYGLSLDTMLPGAKSVNV